MTDSDATMMRRVKKYFLHMMEHTNVHFHLDLEICDQNVVS